MASLSFPDLNVWLALLTADHVHHHDATGWWDGTPAVIIAFTRFTQIGLLRLLTTAAVMNGKPRTMRQAWEAYDRLFDDDRVALLTEPPDVESAFRERSSGDAISPKLWADIYLAAFAARHNGTLVTFDQALKHHNPDCIVLPDPHQ